MSRNRREEYRIESSSDQRGQQRRRNNRSPIQIIQNCNCGRPSNENPVAGENDYNLESSSSSSSAIRPNCGRYCNNVCRSLFGRNREQCIKDCLACQKNKKKKCCRRESSSY